MTQPERTIHLRKFIPEDLPVFFEQQLDPEAIHMAAFTAKDPSDRATFDAHWAKILADDGITLRTILVEGRVAGHISSHGWFGEPEITYWLGKEFWGQGIATRALAQFLQIETTRPLYARAAADNLGSRRVLEKCGFRPSGKDRGFANGRGEEVDEVILRLDL